MHRDIFSKDQTNLLPLVVKFSKDFGLVGGTAIALQVGHRRSIDFDLFTVREFDNDAIRAIVREGHVIQQTFVENPNELTILIDGVKFTFYKYPFQMEFSEKFDNIIKMPDLITLGAMKAFALGKRAKWKDYVDLFFIFKKYSLVDITRKAKMMFKTEFNEKLLREQLAYFEDIDYSENIDYMPDFSVENKEIEKRLEDVSLQK